MSTGGPDAGGVGVGTNGSRSLVGGLGPSGIGGGGGRVSIAPGCCPGHGRPRMRYAKHGSPPESGASGLKSRPGTSQNSSQSGESQPGKPKSRSILTF
jgi:hypothetical protein